MEGREFSRLYQLKEKRLLNLCVSQRTLLHVRYTEVSERGGRSLQSMSPTQVFLIKCTREVLGQVARVLQGGLPLVLEQPMKGLTPCPFMGRCD